MEKIYANQSNLCAIDHLGRRVTVYEEAGEKKEKLVGLFYYLWHGYHGTQGPYDVTKILKEHPDALNHPLDESIWPAADHTPMLHWGESMFGYYTSQDEWVLRRHVQMFIDAGVDVLFFDVTNGFTYRKAYLKLFEILREYLNQGFKAPKICFYTAPAIRGCGTGNLMDLWEQLYEPRLYSDLYFYWEGRPLIICHSMRSLPEEIRNFFTFRSPTWRDPKQPETWAWEGNPQKVAVDRHGNPEEIAVNVCRVDYDPNYEDKKFHGMSDAYFGVPMMGRSWHNGAKDTRENASQYGFLFQEQIETALASPAKLAFVCQWNEWLVPFLTEKTNTLYPMDHPILLVDEYSEEYSRDVEPMKGGYQDAYYLQMTSFIRRFKGMDAPQKATDFHTVQINDDFSQWEKVFPIYHEYTGDVAPRNGKAYDAIGKYVNMTGRNEFHYLKVAADAENVYFYAECTNCITSEQDSNWMMLFLKNPALSANAWEGYHFVVNRSTPEGQKAILEQCSENGKFSWKEKAKVNYAVKGNQLHLSVPKKLLGITEDNFRLEFKWSDNMQEADVMDFYINGDAAPRGRFNYLYIFEK